MAFGAPLAAAMDAHLRSPEAAPLSANYVAGEGRVAVSSLGATHAAALGAGALALDLLT